MAAAALGALLIAVPFALAANSDRSTTVHSQAQAQAADSGSTALPTSATVSSGGSAADSPSGQATPHATPSAAARQPSAGSSAAVPVQQQGAAAVPATAAAAVVRLGESAPGRHICYRVYVTGGGWQAPACDGAQAGVIGKTIEAMDIAVSGTSGGSANAYMEKTGWEYGVWPSEPDGQDIVIGSPGAGVPVTGNTVSVGSGSVCVDDYVSDNVGWEKHCTTSGNWTFVGTLNTTTLLVEAVKFSV